MHGLEFVPLPLHGDQLVALTHAEDVASMLASVVGNENAANQVKAEGCMALTSGVVTCGTGRGRGCGAGACHRVAESKLNWSKGRFNDASFHTSHLFFCFYQQQSLPCLHPVSVCRFLTVRPIGTSRTTGFSGKLERYEGA